MFIKRFIYRNLTSNRLSLRHVNGTTAHIRKRDPVKPSLISQKSAEIKTSKCLLRGGVLAFAVSVHYFKKKK
jgi:hypothetical protein